MVGLNEAKDISWIDDETSLIPTTRNILQMCNPEILHIQIVVNQIPSFGHIYASLHDDIVESVVRIGRPN